MLFGVFDGHGGRDTAEFTRKELKNTIISRPEFKTGNYKVALE